MLLVLLLAGCGASEAPPEAPVARRDTPPSPGARALPERDGGPRIETFTFTPLQPTVEDVLSVSVAASDPEAVDPLDIDLLWIVNGQRLLDEVAESLGAGIVKKGDEVMVEATASTHERETTRRSQPIRIANSPPVFVDDPRQLGELDGYAVEATDPDGDVLTWSIEGGPPGLAIDPETGVLDYRGDPSGKGGDFTIVVTVDDGDLGVARWSFAITEAPGGAVAEAGGAAPTPTGLPPLAPVAVAPVDDAATWQARDEVSEASAGDQVDEARARDEVPEFVPRAPAPQATGDDDAGTFVPRDDGR